ncbi:MG2 domain-containing protein [Myxococcaceae bacterium GXIMD 01537]
MQLTIDRRSLVVLGVGLLLGGGVFVARSGPCLSAWLFQGVKVPVCPDGRMRQTAHLSAESLRRGTPGEVRVWAEALGVQKGDRWPQMKAPVRRVEAALAVVDSAGQETPLAPAKGWEKVDGEPGVLRGAVTLPALPDGDYTLRARLTTPLGTDTAEAALPLYAPARVHVLTDRPLYEPGHRVQFRAVALRTNDLAPLDGRPGTWRVMDPTGEVVLEERAPAGPWGVVAGAIPLDRGAPTGRWTVRWQSGGDQGEASFRVEPFTLPRFRAEAGSPRPFWRAGEVPSVEGQVVYSSGAPVVGAEVSLTWAQRGGAWPVPREWLEGALPAHVKTDAAGRFQVKLPAVPYDLRGQATLAADVAATDATGERVAASVALLLSEDAIAVTAVTELEGGLVENFSNRVYLRATTADGRVLPGAELTVQRAWDPKDPGVRAVTDEDGVAALQLDPGVAVNVVVPPMPRRRSATVEPVSLWNSLDLLGEGHEVALDDQVGLEQWVAPLAPCARFVSPDEDSLELQFGVRVGAAGAVTDLVGSEDSMRGARGALHACAAQVLRARKLPPGRERLLSLSFQFKNPELPTLSMEEPVAAGGTTQGVDAALQVAALDARECLPRTLEGVVSLPADLSWRVHADRPELTASWVPVASSERVLSASVMACIQARFKGLKLPPVEPDEEKPGNALGVVRFTAVAAESDDGEGSPQATTLLGYELKVSAREAGRDSGSTKLILRTAELPPTRLRATPVLAKAGEEVRIELLRGPGFTGTLPEKLVLRAGRTELEAKVDRRERAARFRLPESFEGWAEAVWENALTRVYVPPRAQLSVEVSPERTAYAPGEVARLQVRTRVDGQDGPAAVGLFGVDEAMAQLAPLPGGDALGGMRPAPAMASSAFGVLDGQALVMGRIRGAHAAAAALLRVSDVPIPDLRDPPLSVSGETPFAPDVELTDAFYRVLAELNTQVRAWEASAPEGETLSPAGVAKLWTQSIAACEGRGEAVTDAYGRQLRLSRLPRDLLALTDPRVVVVSGSRLPEDVENWGAWVARELP